MRHRCDAVRSSSPFLLNEAKSVYPDQFCLRAVQGVLQTPFGSRCPSLACATAKICPVRFGLQGLRCACTFQQKNLQTRTLGTQIFCDSIFLLKTLPAIPSVYYCGLDKPIRHFLPKWVSSIMTKIFNYDSTFQQAI